MRISDTKVAQLVEVKPPFVVLLDESTGTEAHFYPRDVTRAVHQISTGDRPTELKGIPLTIAEEAYLVFAFGYFWGALNAES